MPGTAVLRTSGYLRTPSKKGKYDRHTQTPNDHITLSRLNSLYIQKNQSRNWLRNNELMILGGK